MQDWQEKILKLSYPPYLKPFAVNAKVGDKLVLGHINIIPVAPEHYRLYGHYIARMSRKRWTYPTHFAPFSSRLFTITVAYLSYLNSLMLGIANANEFLQYFESHKDFFYRLPYLNLDSTEEDPASLTKARLFSKYHIKNDEGYRGACIFSMCKRVVLPMKKEPVSDSEFENAVEFGRKLLQKFIEEEHSKVLFEATIHNIAVKIANRLSSTTVNIIFDSGMTGTKFLTLLLRELKKRQVRYRLWKFRNDVELFEVTGKVKETKQNAVYIGTVTDKFEYVVPVVRVSDGIAIITSYGNKDPDEITATLESGAWEVYELDWKRVLQVC